MCACRMSFDSRVIGLFTLLDLLALGGRKQAMLPGTKSSNMPDCSPFVLMWVKKKTEVAFRLSGLYCGTEKNLAQRLPVVITEVLPIKFRNTTGHRCEDTCVAVKYIVKKNRQLYL